MLKANDRSRELFRAVLPADSRVHVRPMFGNLAAFVNGNMFCGLFGDGLFVRLPEDERAALLLEPGAGMLEPMAGRPLREYVVLPRAWQAQPELLREWLRRGLTWTASLPVRAPKRGRMAR